MTSHHVQNTWFFFVWMLLLFPKTLCLCFEKTNLYAKHADNSSRGKLRKWLIYINKISIQLTFLTMYLDEIHGIKHLTWLCRVDRTLYFVEFNFMSKMNPHTTRFYVILTPFCFLYSVFTFLNQRDLIAAYSLAAQAHLQSVCLHKARYCSYHFLYKHWNLKIINLNEFFSIHMFS